jgi:type I restriction enzyme S subunit
MPRANVGYLLSLKVPVPSPDEQQRIVTRINAKLAVVEKAKKSSGEQYLAANGLPDVYLKGIFNFDKIPQGWKKEKVKNICNVARGGSPRPIQSYITKSEDGINWIKIGDVEPNEKYIKRTSEKITHDGAKKSRLVSSGDFILSNSMSFGRPYILKIGGCIHDGWLVLKDISNQINQDYLYYVLCSSAVKQQFIDAASGAIVKNLNIEKVEETHLPIPPLDEQREIVEKLEIIIAKANKIKNRVEDQSIYINALPAAILRKAFKGEL